MNAHLSSLSRHMHANRRRYGWGMVGLGVAAAGAVALSQFAPLGMVRGLAERSLTHRLGAPAHIGSLERFGGISAHPELVLRDVRVEQPGWVGASGHAGDMVRLDTLRLRVALWPLLRGAVQIEQAEISGGQITYIRRADGMHNWPPPRAEDKDGKRAKSKAPDIPLIVHDLKISARDEKRHLDLTGRMSVDGVNGLSIAAHGQFDGTPATVTAKAPPVSGRTGAWPFTLSLASPVLTMHARGTAPEPLDLAHMSVSLQAQGRSLRELDYIIQAGLFGTQPINLSADVRHDGRDWLIDRLEGSVGKSRLRGAGTVLKRGGRTKVDATIIASTFDFDDLSDDNGQAKGARQKARIGPRVIPDTRINLSRVGPTDGVIHFRADHLLLNPGSPFKSLKGDIVLQGKVLRLNHVEAGLSSGRMTGWLQVDSTHPVPVLTTELNITGSSLEGLLGAPQIIAGPLVGRVRLTGRGDTIRAAFARGDGRLGFVATSGSIRRNVADMLGANLGGALVHSVVDPGQHVPLTCAVLGFAVRGGVMVPDPVAVDTAVSLGLATGSVSLRDETIAMTMRGQARSGAALKLADPIRLGGTLSSPQIRLTDQGGASMGKVIGRALGALFDKSKKSEATIEQVPQGMTCKAMIARAIG